MKLIAQSKIDHNFLNYFWAIFLFLYPLKTPENLWFSGVFRGYEIGTLTKSG